MGVGGVIRECVERLLRAKGRWDEHHEKLSHPDQSLGCAKANQGQ